MVFAISFVLALGLTKASEMLFLHSFKNMLKSPVSFFHVKTTSRILECYTDEMEYIDLKLPELLRSSLTICFTV